MNTKLRSCPKRRLTPSWNEIVITNRRGNPSVSMSTGNPQRVRPFSGQARIAVCFCIPLGFLYTGCSGNLLTDSKAVRIVEPEIDLGTFKSTDMIENRVTVHNGSEASYQLTSITLSCGCLTTDFEATELGPGESYSFSLNLFNALLGKGKQQGEIATNPKLEPPLRFQVEYEVEPATYLFPNHFLMDSVSDADSDWTGVIEFEVRALDEEVEITGPIGVEPAAYSYPSGLSYAALPCTLLKQGHHVRLSVSRGTFSGGRFHDQLMLTIPTADGPLRFAIGATGDVNWSDQPSEGNGR